MAVSLQNYLVTEGKVVQTQQTAYTGGNYVPANCFVVFTRVTKKPQNKFT